MFRKWWSYRQVKKSKGGGMSDLDIARRGEQMAKPPKEWVLLLFSVMSFVLAAACMAVLIYGI